MDGSFSSQYSFAPNANSGQSSRTYWLSSGEDVLVSADYALGAGYPPEVYGGSLTAVILVNGRAVAFSFDGAAAATRQSLVLPEVPGRFARQIAISHGAIAPGASNASIAYFSPRGFLVGFWDFNIFNQGTSFPAFAETPAVVLPATGGLGTIDLTNNTIFDAPNHEVVPSNPLTLRMRIGSTSVDCENEPRFFFVTALLDGEEIALSGESSAMYFAVPAKSYLQVDVNLIDLPFDENPHSLVLYQTLANTYWETSKEQGSYLSEPGRVIGRGHWGFD